MRDENGRMADGTSVAATEFFLDHCAVTQLTELRDSLTEWEAYLVRAMHVKVIDNERRMNPSQRRVLNRISERLGIA